jgi:hypothetical protein
MAGTKFDFPKGKLTVVTAGSMRIGWLRELLTSTIVKL